MFGMVERGERLRFALEAREPFGIVTNASGRILIATRGSSRGVLRPIDRAHAAFADQARSSRTGRGGCRGLWPLPGEFYAIEPRLRLGARC